MPPSCACESNPQMFVHGVNSACGESTRKSIRKDRSTSRSTTEISRRKNELNSEQKDYVYTKVTSDTDFDVVCRSLALAEQSCWYYGDCSSAEAKAVLKHESLGTFLMRNSSDPKFLFSLSVKTERGPTSVRIRYSRGLFQMDCEHHLKNKLPRFDNVVGLVNFHMTLCKTKGFSDCRWLEKSGRRDMPVTLSRPKRNQTPALQHLCRLKINSCMDDLHLPERSTHRLPVPDGLKRYLEDYPYTL